MVDDVPFPDAIFQKCSRRPISAGAIGARGTTRRRTASCSVGLHTLYDRGLLELSEGIARFSPLVAHQYAHLDGAPVAVRQDPGGEPIMNLAE